MLCQTCIQASQATESVRVEWDDKAEELRVTNNHHDSWESLTNSVEINCQLCSLFYNRIRKDEKESPIALGHGHLSELTIRFKEQAGTLGHVATSLKISLNGGLSASYQYFSLFNPAPRRLVSSTASEDSWSAAVAWLRNCIANHEKCATETTEWAPTRLLNVGPDSGCPVRLVQSSEISSDRKYVTLSHCWGGQPILQLKHDTKSRLFKGLSSEDLPLTFRHAVEVVRRLQIRYIWIDSLCIFQDEDKTDWMKEAQLMHKVYSYAVFNIAAVGAKNSSKGLYFPHRGGLGEWQRIRLPRNLFINSEGTTQYLVTVDDDQTTQSELELSPLNRRAWFQQERWLARRTLFFTQGQLYWSCRTAFASEEWPLDHPRNRFNTAFEYPALSIDLHPERPQHGTAAPEDREMAYQCWRNICDRYSRTNLTYSSDKLIALAGLAQCVGRIVNDSYVAGMWRRNIAQDILWHVEYLDDRWRAEPTSSPSCRPSKWRAPSFSWASVDGPVILHRPPLGDFDTLLSVVDVRLHLVDGPYGPLTGATLRLRGYLRPVHLQPLEDGEERDFRRNVHISGGEASFGPPHVIPDAEFDDSLEEAETHGLLYSIMAEFEQDVRILALLLLCVEKRAGRFRRVGLISMLCEDSSSDYLEPYQNAKDLPCVVYDEENGVSTIDVE